MNTTALPDGANPARVAAGPAIGAAGWPVVEADQDFDFDFDIDFEEAGAGLPRMNASGDRRPTRPLTPHQRGMALIMGLVLLMVITLLSLAGMRGITMQERMSSNMRDRNLGLQAAESALREAEAALRSGAAVPVSQPVDRPWDFQFWNQCFTRGGDDCPGVTELTGFDRTAGLAAAPAYVIERLSATNHGSLAADRYDASATLLRITARAVGGTPDSVVILQATFAP
jgi:type IV pilus assembly protein PilX